MLHDTALAEDSRVARVVSVAAQHADSVDRERRFPAEAIDALRDEGLLSAMVPRELGGRSASLSVAAAVTQRLSGACASTGMIFAMHQIQLACLVNHGLDHPWHQAFARSVVNDRLLLASITSEIGIGGDMRSSLCAVEVTGNRFHVAKQASTVSYGAYADAFLVSARAHADAPRSDQVLVTVLRPNCEMTATGKWDALGMRGTCSTGFTFAGTGHADQIMPGAFAEIAAETMTPVSHLLWAAVWTGIAVEAVSRARKFLRAQARRQPGAPPPGAARLIRAIGLLESAHARTIGLLAQYDACHAWGSDRVVVSEEEAGWPVGMKRDTVINMLKFDVSEMSHQAVFEAMLICGMAGYRNDTEYSVGRHLRDVLSAQLMISNDRIAVNTGGLLLAQRHSLGIL